MHWWWHEFDDHNAYQHFYPVRKFVDRLPLLQRRWFHIPISRSNGTVPKRSCTLPSQAGHFPKGEGHVIANFADVDPETCQQRCCNDTRCQGWIFTTYQIISTHAPCEMGHPCCWLKAGVGDIEPLPNCTAGLMSRRAQAGTWQIQGGAMLGETGGGQSDTAAIWLHNAAHTWRTQHSPAAMQLVGPVAVTLPFSPGKLVTVSLVDTHTGAITRNTTLTVESGGLQLHFEPFVEDVAALVTLKTD